MLCQSKSIFPLSSDTNDAINKRSHHKRSAQKGTHNGMTPKDAGHVILNLFTLWEPCTELTLESLESQAKQDHSAP